MRILSITAGAASMYCGSCLRDNALAAELLARGHDVTLLPLYTPTLTDEENVSRHEVLFGGINIYLKQRSSLFRRTPRFLQRLLDSPGLISLFADRSVSTDARVLGDLTVSMLEGVDGVLRDEFVKLRDWVASEPLPDVINLPNSMLIAIARPLAEAFKRPICCTLQGEELFLSELVEPFRTRALDLVRKQVRYVDRFVAVSEFGGRYMTQYLQIPSGRLSVVPLGIVMKGYEAPKTRTDDTFRIGYLARLAPEKGLHLLAEAFVQLRKRTGKAPVRLEVAGYLGGAHKPYLAEVRRTLERAGALGDFTYHGTVDRAAKLDFLRQIDVLSVPAVYDEQKGMFLLEAMASGVPVVQPRRGAFIELVQKTGGGLLVEPDAATSLADGLESLWRDRGLREELGRKAYDGVRTHYTVQRSADRLIEVYEEVVGRRTADAAGTGCGADPARLAAPA
jgi:glycosyltransferase involved in cell wall biosynthesis